MKKYYVKFINHFRKETVHCFEQEKEQAEHFARLVNGTVIYDF